MEKKADTGLIRLDTSKLGTITTIPFAQRVPTTNLGPGSCTLVFSAMDTSNRTVKRSVDLEVE